MKKQYLVPETEVLMVSPQQIICGSYKTNSQNQYIDLDIDDEFDPWED